MKRLVIIATLFPLTAFSQGPLEPPAGPPVPSMKTLDQLEARTPLIAGSPGVAVTPGGNITIQASGSYYLTGNLAVASGDGIAIASDDVSLDLNGFTISSTASTATGVAIRVNGVSRIAISNGHIRSGVTYSDGAFSTGPGFNSGIDWSSAPPKSARVSGISISGVKSYGIDLGNDDSCIVQGCTVRTVSILGIQAGVVTDSSVTVGGPNTIKASRIANSIGSRADGSGSGITTTGSSFDTLATTVNATQTAVNTTQTAVSSVQTTANSILAAADKRTPISSLPFTISTPGSYYFTQNLQFTASSGNAITISASGVTLDLGGFTLSSSSGVAGNAIVVGSVSGVTVKNGHITGNTTVAISGTAPKTWTVTPAGFGIGIKDSATGSRYQELGIQGCRTVGLDAISGENTIIEKISVSANGTHGIYSQFCSISNCSANSNGSIGIFASLSNVINSTANENKSNGISSINGNVTSSNAYENGDNGISASGSVTNSTAYSNENAGISVGFGVAAHCAAGGNSTDTTTTDKEINVTAGGQRDACVPASE